MHYSTTLGHRMLSLLELGFHISEVCNREVPLNNHMCMYEFSSVFTMCTFNLIAMYCSVCSGIK